MDPTVALVILVVAAGLVASVVLFMRRRTREDDSIYHFRCPKCRRRLRYLSRQVGRKGKCSNCNAEVLFPPTSQSVD